MFLDLSDNISMNKCLSQKMLCAARLASIFAVVVSSQNFCRRDALDKAFLDAQAGLLAQALAEGASCNSTHSAAMGAARDT